MNIREELLKEHSKSQVLKITDYIGDDDKRLDELIQLFLYGEYRVSQRGSWVLSHIADQNIEKILPYLPQMVKNLDDKNHDAVIRNTIRIFQNIDIPDDLIGIVADKCFDYLSSPKYPVAIRVFSMTVLFNICKKIPELKNELQMIIEDFMPHGSAGFKSRGKKVLKDLKKF